MDDAVSRVLAEYDARIADETRQWQSVGTSESRRRRDEFLLPIGADTAHVVHTLIRSAKSQSILELGTSYGYSTIWLADAARATDGKVITLELADYKAEFARKALERAGLSNRVDMHLGSALETLPRLPGPFDFVLLDLWKDLYVACLDLVYPKLAPGAFVVADNMIFPPEVHADAERYRHRIRQLDFDTVLLPIGSGIEVSRRR
jgi:predicted O-methyltransferase YrrM